MEASKRNNSNHHSNNSRKKPKNQTPEGNFRDELHLCSKAKDLSAAISLYDSAGSKNIRLNHYHFNVFLYICSNSVSDLSEDQTCARNSAFEFGFRIFDRMLAEGVKPTEATITALARLAAAKGDGDRAFDLVKSMAKYGLMPRLRSYEPALMCYCRNLLAEKAYEIEEHMGSMGVALEEPELAALLNVSAETRKGEKVYEYLHKLRGTVRSVTDTTAEAMERWFGGQVAAEVGFQNLDEGLVKEAILKNGGGWHGLGWFGKGKWVTHRSKVDVRGCCISCGEELDSVDIGTEETEKFAESVASLALEREAHSNFKEFQDWLDEHGDYEAIVDGANIGLYQQNFAEGGFSISQLDAVVHEVYKRSNKWPLVVLHSRRIPMLQENESNRGIVEKWLAKGILYGTPYGSNDDWYWLYAAVKLKCLLVTNDEMRDHIFELLGSSFFLRWKERHQVRYTFLKGDLKLQMPPVFSVVIQESGKGSWHVPLAGDHEDECSRTWLCFTRQHYSETSDQRSATKEVKEGS